MCACIGVFYIVCVYVCVCVCVCAGLNGRVCVRVSMHMTKKEG